MKITREFLFGAFGAGMLIGLASLSFCRCGRYLGAALFGLGLLVVLIAQLWLFTGKIGYISRSTLKPLFSCLPFNLLGAIACAFLATFAFDAEAMRLEEIVPGKLGQTELQTFFRAMFCGFCMVTAVESWKKAQSTFGVLLSVFIFVASGFEHCIADMFYLAAGCIALDDVTVGSVAKFIAIAILGNAAGSILLKSFIPDVKINKEEVCEKKNEKSSAPTL